MKILVKRLDIGTIYNVNGKCLNNKQIHEIYGLHWQHCAVAYKCEINISFVK